MPVFATQSQTIQGIITAGFFPFGKAVEGFVKIMYRGVFMIISESQKTVSLVISCGYEFA